MKLLTLDIRFIFLMVNFLAMASVLLLVIYAHELNQNINMTIFMMTSSSVTDLRRMTSAKLNFRRNKSDDYEEKHNSTTQSTLDFQGFQSVGDDVQTYVYSAIFDDIYTPLIRVITLVPDLRKRKTKRMYTCTYSHISGDLSRPYRGILQYVPEPEWGYSYRSAFIRCKVPRGQRPNMVIIRQIGRTTGGTSLRVIYPLKTRWRLTRCLSVLHSNFRNTMQFIQTIEFSLLFGVEHFIVYNYSIHESVSNVLKKYRDMGVLDILPWNLPINASKIHYFGQLAAIQECLYRNLHVSEYLLTGDTDELFVPKMYNSTLEMITKNFEGRPSCSGLVVRNSFFPLNLPAHSGHFHSKSEARRLNLTYLSHTRRLKVENPFERSKLVIKPTGVEIGGIHDMKLYRRGQGGCICPYNHCLLHHYRYVPKEDMGSVRVTDTSLHDYSDIIVKQINDRLKVFKL